MPQVTLIIRTLAVSVFLACSAIGSAVTAQEFQQIQLTDDHITKFISAQADLAKLNTGTDEAAQEGAAEEAKEASDTEAAPEVDEKLQAELDKIAVKHGFKNYAELDDVAANIALVLAGIDDKSGEYTDPRKQLQDELAGVKADDKLGADEKKSMIEEIEDAIAATPELKHPGNIELVKKHRQAIEKSLE
jgi:hypothetical protein